MTPRAIRAALLLVALVLPGWAACDGARLVRIEEVSWDCAEPHPWVSFRGDAYRDPVIRLHAEVHLEQAERMGCAAFNRALKSAAGYAELEREAVCEAHRRHYGRPMPGTLCEEG